MREVLIDNMSFGSAIAEYYFIDERDWPMAWKKDPNIQKYLFGLVLWDNMYSLDWRKNNYSMSSYNISLFKKLKRDIDVKRIRKEMCVEQLNFNDIKEDLREISTVANQLTEDMALNLSFKDERVMHDTLFYLLLSHNANMNLLLSKPRTEVLEDSGMSQHIFDRLNMIGLLEDDVVKYYEEINKKIHKNYIQFECPLLADYICKNTGSLKEAIQVAKEMRKEKNIVDFRKAMDELEISMSEGKHTVFDNYVSEIPRIVEDITHGGEKCVTFDLGLGFSPTITIPVKFKYRKKKLLHVDFLIDLAKFGVEGRKL